MKTPGTFVAITLFAVLMAMPVYGQQPEGTHDHAQPPAGTAPEPPAGPKGPQMPMMDMCRDMMGGMPGMAMTGPSGRMGPREHAAMLEMRGDMMKAMGDVMLKHARRMQGTTDK
jgi:hypothetical protein